MALLVIPDVYEEEEPSVGRTAPPAPPRLRDTIAEASVRATVVVPLKTPDPLLGD